MDVVRDVAGWLAAGFISVGAIIYIRSVWRRTTVTRWSSWLIWTFTAISTFSTYYGSGARESVLMPAAYIVFCAATLVAALVRRSPGGLDKVEVLCLIGAALGGLVWVISGSAEYGQIASVASEMIAYVPIMMDARGENRLAWSMDTMGSVVNLIAVPAVSFGLLLYPVAILACNATVTVLIGWQRRAPSGEPAGELDFVSV